MELHVVLTWNLELASETVLQEVGHTDRDSFEQQINDIQCM